MSNIKVKGRLSYAYIFEPRLKMNSEEKEYAVNILIPKGDPQIPAVEAAIKEAEQRGIEICKKWKGKKPKENFWNALRDGDEKTNEDPVYKGHWYLNAKSKTRPQIVKREAKGQPLEKITDPTELASGDYAVVTVSFFPFDKGANGIGVGLGNILKWKTGERLAGGSTAEQDFGDEDLVTEEEDDVLA